jgi:sulfite exporter TauE/SafE
VNLPADLPVLLTAFLAGLLGGGHCFGMCGGIAGTLGALGGQTHTGSRWAPGLLFNFGRISSYALLGGVAAVLLGGTGEMLHVPGWARMLRLLTVAMIFLIGLRFLFNIRALDRLEQAGAGLWRLVQPLAIRLSARPGLSGRLLLGACWGLLPCGLVYSVMLTAASTASFAGGALVMLGFGAGTLPAMLGMTWMSPLLHALMRDPWVRRLVGFSLVVLALWAYLMMGGQGMHG